MGALVGKVCYSTVEAARDAIFTDSAPVFVPGTTSYQWSTAKTGADWYSYLYSFNASGTPTLMYSILRAPSFPYCDPVESFTDGMTIGWGIATAMVMATCIVMMKRAAR